MFFFCLNTWNSKTNVTRTWCPTRGLTDYMVLVNLCARHPVCIICTVRFFNQFKCNFTVITVLRFMNITGRVSGKRAQVKF